MSTLLPSRFIPHSININTAGGAVSAWINQIKSYSENDGVALFEESSGSETDTAFVAVKDINPTMPITTTDLTFLGTCGFSGIHIIPDSSDAGLIAYGRQLSVGSLPTAIGTSAHIKMICSDGLLVPVSVHASHNSVALFQLMLHAILGTVATYSGATPFVFSRSNVIPSGAAQTANIFTTGVFKYDSRLVTGITDINVTFGIQVFKESDSGNVYPSIVAIIGRAPKIEFATRDMGLADEIGDGVAIGTSATAYFRAVAANGQRVALATTSHISVGGTAGMITPGALTLTHKAPGTQAFTYTPVLNTNTIVITNGVAIPAS